MVILLNPKYIRSGRGGHNDAIAIRECSIFGDSNRRVDVAVFVVLVVVVAIETNVVCRRRQ